ncbi:transposase [Kitasatospora sp. NPDC001261]|uniref:transposase n=1 Tax=Kitasatospora sp. NPDC001261 TaxID=3364012 RepID=UPI00369DEA40
MHAPFGTWRSPAGGGGPPGWVAATPRRRGAPNDPARAARREPAPCRQRRVTTWSRKVMRAGRLPSTATVRRIVRRLAPFLALEAAPRPRPGVERLWIVDGTLIPVRDRTVAASSRNYRFSANVQVVIDADTRLVVATARPVPGNRADAHAWRASDLPATWAGTTVLADGAYLNTGLVVPHRRRPGRPLLRAQEEDNAEHRRVRARVEHTFARMKNHKILRDCRQKGGGLHHAVQAAAHMHNLARTP